MTSFSGRKIGTETYGLSVHKMTMAEIQALVKQKTGLVHFLKSYVRGG